jgi:2-amino-4-hydroxy-6-hydroxymethyldihydropteridine diphosphokinase
LRAIAIALGSNLGSRDRNIRAAADALGRILHDVTLSSLVETTPVGHGLEDDPPYLNAAVVGQSDRPVRDIFETLRGIETAAGRTRPYPGAPRTLDLDLILVGDEVVEEGDLHVPHPRFRDRRFVLDPLVEIAPELVDPITRLTVRQLRDRLLSKGPGAQETWPDIF